MKGMLCSVLFKQGLPERQASSSGLFLSCFMSCAEQGRRASNTSIVVQCTARRSSCTIPGNTKKTSALWLSDRARLALLCCTRSGGAPPEFLAMQPHSKLHRSLISALCFAQADDQHWRSAGSSQLAQAVTGVDLRPVSLSISLDVGRPLG